MYTLCWNICDILTIKKQDTSHLRCMFINYTFLTAVLAFKFVLQNISAIVPSGLIKSLLNLIIPSDSHIYV